MIPRTESHNFSEFQPSNFSQVSPALSSAYGLPGCWVLECRNTTDAEDEFEVKVVENKI